MKIKPFTVGILLGLMVFWRALAWVFGTPQSLVPSSILEGVFQFFCYFGLALITAEMLAAFKVIERF